MKSSAADKFRDVREAGLHTQVRQLWTGTFGGHLLFALGWPPVCMPFNVACCQRFLRRTQGWSGIHPPSADLTNTDTAPTLQGV